MDDNNETNGIRRRDILNCFGAAISMVIVHFHFLMVNIYFLEFEVASKMLILMMILLVYYIHSYNSH